MHFLSLHVLGCPFFCWARQPTVLECSRQTNKPLWLSHRTPEGYYKRSSSGKGIWRQPRIRMGEVAKPSISPELASRTQQGSAALNRPGERFLCVPWRRDRGRLFWRVRRGERWCGMATMTDCRLLSCARFRAGRRHSRHPTEHVLWKCLSAGMHSALGQITKHFEAIPASEHANMTVCFRAVHQKGFGDKSITVQSTLGKHWSWCIQEHISRTHSCREQ